MKNLSLLTIFLLASLFGRPTFVQAQYSTDFLMTDAPKEVTKENVQKNISLLLTQFNSAFMEKRTPDFAGIAISPDAQSMILKLWTNTPLRCGETEIIERCLKTSGNFQVRNIPLFLMPAEGGEEKPQYQEAVIGFNPKGELTDFHLAISSNLYSKVLANGQAVADFAKRQMILDYVEQFRTAYNTKDIVFLNQIFSDDALIITGKVVKAVPTDMNITGANRVVYTKQTKKEYINRLTAVFKNNKQIRVTFDDLKIVRHPAKEAYYGVTLKQGYSSDKYSDEGYLFLLWDFTNPDAPKIHVRTWQPSMLNISTQLPEEEIFTCNDFDIN